MKKLEEFILEKTLIVDGGMGTSLMRYGLSPDDYHGYVSCPDYLVISRPDVISTVHAGFIEAGADIIETNTFGAARAALEHHGLGESTYEINRKAAEIARRTALDYSSAGPKFVSGSMGPGRRLPSLLQTTYDELKESYYIQAQGLIDGGVDLFQVETCQDMLQSKAALSALFKAMAEKKKKLPVILQVTLEHNGRLLLGTDLSAVIAAFSSYDLFALGFNCGTGPESMHETVRELSQKNPFHCSVLPNAGLPEIVNGKLSYSQTPEIFASHLKRFVAESGIEIVGGCCGTTHEHIKALAEAVKDIPVKRRKKAVPVSASASLYTSQNYSIEPRPLIIGEKTNATGSKKFREALLSNDFEAMTELAKEQEKEGAHMLDLSVAYPGVDEAGIIGEMVRRLSKELRIPLSIDSTSVDVIETALKNYAGKALINSINLEGGGEKAGRIIELAREYGASVIALTIDDDGMAKTVERKVAVAGKILELTRSKGLPDADVLIDPLTFTLGSGDQSLYNAGVDTLNGVKEIKKAYPGIKVILGVSNVSYGLNEKARKVINSVFLFHAVQYGLDAAIFHAGKVIPFNRIPEEARKAAEDLIFNKRDNDNDPLENIIAMFDKTSADTVKEDKVQLTLEEELTEAIIEGKKKGLEDLLGKALEKYRPLEIINDFLLKGMAEVGEQFGKGILQLPFVLKSAETMKKAADILSVHFQADEMSAKAGVVLATVKGDVHDIGKNLVDIILSNNGFKIHNIGIDCTPQTIADAVIENKADFIGLSGLLVSSAEEMKNVVAHFNERGITTPVLCGGAALNAGFVSGSLAPIYNGKIFYAKDSFEAVRIMETGEGHAVKSDETKEISENILRVDINKDYERPVKPFSGTKELDNIKFSDIEKYLNKNRLFKIRWADDKDNDQLYAKCSEKASELTFKAVYGYFNKEETGFDFPRRKTSPQISLSDFITDKDFSAVFIATAGQQAVEISKKLFGEQSYTNFYYWYGFAAEVTEALAEYLNDIIRKELSVPDKQGRRYSPGYSVWPDLSEQKKICKLLDSESIGVNLTENFQLVPELSVSGIYIYHPEAVYFNIE